MKRALSATIASAATVALLVPLVATADHAPGHKDGPTGPNPDLTIEADPNIVPFGKTTTISGRLRGQDNAGKTIELGENPFPFRDNDPFRPVAETTTDANGDYSFQVTPELNTNYRVRTQGLQPEEEISGPVFVRVKMRITRSVDDRTPERGQLVTFSGKVVPEHDDLNVLLQRRRPSGTWRTLAQVALDPGPATENSSVYTHQIEVNRDGVWRAKIKRDADHLGNRSRRIRIDVQ
jgi:hypothetical protein